MQQEEENKKPEIDIEQSMVLPVEENHEDVVPVEPEGEALPPEGEVVRTAPEVEAEKIDLDKKRDEKCFPVASQVLRDIADDLIPPDANIQVDYNPVVMKMLKAYLEADLNIATEMTYIPQLLLNVFSGLNRIVQMCEFVQIDDLRYGGIARKILRILVDANVPLGNLNAEEHEVAFAPVKEQLNALFTDEKLTWLEIKYVMDNIFDSFKVVNGLVGRSIEDSTALAEAKLFGLGTMNELTLKKLDEILTR